MKKAKKAIALIASVLVIVSAFTAMFALADGTEVLWSTSFETPEERSSWSFSELDNDGKSWIWKSDENDAGYPAYDGLYSLYSESRDITKQIKNVAVSGAISLNDATAPRLRVNWYVAAQDFGLPEEQYSVYVIRSTDSANSINTATPVFNETLTEKVLSYHARSVDITDAVSKLFTYNETDKSIKLVFVHHTETARFALKIDSVSVEAYYDYQTLESYDFEDGFQGWTAVDGDGDGNNWEHKTSSQAFDGYLSDGCLASASYDGDDLFPENYLISPEIQVTDKFKSPLLSWYAGSYDGDYCAEEYAVYVYSGSEKTVTSANIDAVISNSSLVFEETLTEKDYHKVSVNLDDLYAGKKIRVIFEHKTPDIAQYWLKIDNVSVKALEKEEPVTGITVTGITEPEVGKKPSFSNNLVLVAEGKPVTPDGTNFVWQKKTASGYTDMTANDVFASDTVYRVNMIITVGDDYVFTNTIPSLTINGNNPTYVSVDSSLKTITVSYDFAPRYTLTFDVDGVKSTTSYVAGDIITKPADPEAKTGYTFAGWDKVIPATMPSNDLVITAKWTINSHKIEWTTDGAVTEQTYNYGDIIVAPAASKTGYTFTGWTPAVPATMPDEDLEFTANFEANTYDAKFYSDGALYTTVPTKYDSVIVAPENPTKAGYTFEGWEPAVGKMDDINGKTFEAKWAPKTGITYTIETYIMDTTGAYGEPTVEKKAGTTDAFVIAPTEIKTGFKTDLVNSVLSGKVAADGSTTLKVYYTRKQYNFTVNVDGNKTTTAYYYEAKVVTPATPAKEGYTFAGWDKEIPEKMPAEDVTITAKWTVNQYTITFDSDAGTEVTPVTQAYGTEVKKPADPTKTGYTFKGWALTKGATKAVKFPYRMPLNGTTLYAIWEINQYTITFVDTGDVAYEAITKNFGEAVDAVADPVKTGYTFAGWDTVIPANMPAENLTITAQWTINQYTITFNMDGGDSIAPIVQNYNTDIDASAIVPNKAGYTFAGWQNEAGEVVEIPEKMPAINITLTAIWEVMDGFKEYAVNTYFMDTEGNYGEPVIEKKSVEADTEVTVTPAEIEGFTFDEENAENVLEGTVTDDTTVLKVYYIRNRYDLTITVDGVEETNTYYFDETVFAADPVKEGYSFTGWSEEIPAKMPAKNLATVANFEINQYTITFDMAGGDTVAPIVQDFNTDIDASAIVPTKTGYTFAGWDKEIPAAMPARNMTITAQWTINQYTITFNTDGGTDIEAITKNYGEAIGTVADPTKTGYTFAGWKNEAGEVADIPATIPAADQTYYAIWVINEYTITFIDTGDVAYEAITKNYGEAIGTVADPTKTGYTFKGWDVAIPENMPAENLTITAKWEANTYDAKFCSDGELYATVPTKYDSEIVAPADPTKTGYTFGGWEPAVGKMDDINGKTYEAIWSVNGYTVTYNANEGVWGNEISITKDAVYGDAVPTVEQPTRTGYSFIGWDKEIPATMPAGNLEFTAQWEINKYTIDFENTGDSTIASITQDYGTAISAVADPVKTGYTFAGWDKEIPATMPAEDITITAKWTVNQYTITFDTNGGTAIVPITQDYGAAISAVADPVKTGYTFAGWDKEIPATMPAEDITITAEWEANSYNAVFLADGEVYATVPTLFDEDIVAPAAPEKTGYTFGGWNPAVGKMDSTDGKIFNAIWNANGNTAYTVNVYTMGTDGNYGAADVKNFTAATDSEVGYSPEIAAGFELNNEKSTTEGIVKPDGSLVLNVYIDRTVYTLTVKADNKETTVDYIYGATVATPATPVKEGHNFTGWSPAVPATMPAEDVTVTAQWKVITYTVKWVVDGAVTETNVDYGATISKPANPTKTGYSFAGWSPAVPATQGAADATYTATWTVNSYTVTWIADGKTTTETYDYGKAIKKPADPTKTGYAFAGWSPAVPATMPANDLTFTAKFDCVASVKIKNNPGECSMNYGDILVMTALAPNLPDGTRIQWYVNGTKATDGERYEEVCVSDVTITVKVVDKNGNAIKDANGKEVSDSQKINVNDGFFQKIISFFKNLFGMDRKKVQ